MRKKVWLFALAAVLLVILAGCRGNELPDGMDEDKVSSAGLAVMSQLTKGEYEEVYDALREDVREFLTGLAQRKEFKLHPEFYRGWMYLH